MNERTSTNKQTRKWRCHVANGCAGNESGEAQRVQREWRSGRCLVGAVAEALPELLGHERHKWSGEPQALLDDEVQHLARRLARLRPASARARVDCEPSAVGTGTGTSLRARCGAASQGGGGARGG